MGKPTVQTETDTSGISPNRADGSDLFGGLARQVVQHAGASRDTRGTTTSFSAFDEVDYGIQISVDDQPDSWNAGVIWQRLAFVPKGMRPALAAIALETSRLLVNDDHTAFLSPQLAVLWEDAGQGIEVSIALIRSVKQLRESSFAPSPGWRAEARRLLHDVDDEDAGDG